MAYYNGKKIMGIVNVVGAGGSDGVNLSNYYTKSEIDKNYVKNEASNTEKDFCITRNSAQLLGQESGVGTASLYFSPYTLYINWSDSNYENTVSISNRSDGTLTLTGSKDTLIQGKSFNDLYDKVQQLSGDYNLIRPSTGTAYTRTIDTTVEKYIYISSVGGMSYKSQNLIIVDDVEETTNSKGITYKVENGVITLNGTATSAHGINLKLKTPLPVGTYTLQNFSGLATNGAGVMGIGNSSYSMILQINMNAAPIYKTATVTSEGVYLTVYANTGATFNNHKLMPMVVKGSTRPTEWEQGYEGIRHTLVSDIKLNDATVIHLNEVYSMEGYGIGINENCYNYLDFDKDVLVKRVGSYTFTGGETITQSSTNSTTLYRYSTNIFKGKIKTVLTNSDIGNILMSDFETTNTNNLYARTEGVAVNQAGDVQFYKESIQTVDDMKTYLTGKTIYYELLEPIENVIPQINTFIEASNGDVITFENQYQKGVASVIKYIKVV